MIIALDENQCRVVASKAKKGGSYFCQGCKKPLCLKQGKIRRPHFAHLSGTPCEYTTNKTEWHYEWQECFGLDNSEIVFSYRTFKHIADIQIGDTVIEFQHSKISEADIAERCEYYHLYGLKVIWVFDIRKDCEEKRIRCYNKRSKYNWLYEWDKPMSSVLKALEMRNTEVYLQVSDKYLLEITWYPNGERKKTHRKNGKTLYEGDYWASMDKFAADIMDKEYAIKHIKAGIDSNYKPKLLIEDGEIISEYLEMAQLGLIS